MNKINGRENLLRIFKNDLPLRLPLREDTATVRFPGDNCGNHEKGKDWWGVSWVVQPFAGAMQDETVPPLFEDIADWQDKLSIPDPYAMCDWEVVAADATASWDRENQMCGVILLQGHFERLVSLMGIENGLCSFYDEDSEDDIRALFSTITEYKLKCLDIIKKYYKPDFVIYHDDWGTARSMFFNPKLWHDFIKDELKRIVDYTHELGMFFEMHSCGHIQEVVGPLVDELGIDSIQTLQYPQNDIRYIKENWGDRLVTRGGYRDADILRKDADEGEIRSAVRESISILAPGGNHIPYFYDLLGKDNSRAINIFYDEVKRYETEIGPC